MKISKKKLSAEARTTRFRSEVLEEVIHLLNLLEGLQTVYGITEFPDTIKSKTPGRRRLELGEGNREWSPPCFLEVCLS